MDCVWKKSCQRLERINGSDKKGNHNHKGDIFEVIIITCSIKNYDRSYKVGDGGRDNKGGDSIDRKQGMYYCVECSGMHHEWSSIGRLHKKILDNRVS